MKTQFTITIWLNGIDQEIFMELDFDSLQSAIDHANYINLTYNKAVTVWRNGCCVMDIG